MKRDCVVRRDCIVKRDCTVNPYCILRASFKGKYFLGVSPPVCVSPHSTWGVSISFA